MYCYWFFWYNFVNCYRSIEIFLFFPLESILNNCVYVCVFGCEVLGVGSKLMLLILKCIYLKLSVWVFHHLKILNFICIMTSFYFLKLFIWSFCMFSWSILKKVFYFSSSHKSLNLGLVDPLYFVFTIVIFCYFFVSLYTLFSYILFFSHILSWILGILIFKLSPLL